jgi:hypothetical protein
MGKYFLVNPNPEHDSERANSTRIKNEELFRDDYSRLLKTRESSLYEEDNLRHIEGRVIVKIDMDSKDSWTFESGLKIEYKRKFNNFNQRETSPVNAIVISGEGMIKDSEILIHPNAIHDSNRIFDYKDSNDNIRYYSIHNDMCFAWHDGNEWQPIKPYEFALRVFKPYEGKLEGIEPTQLKNILFVTSGELKGNVVHTLVACDYQIVFQGKNGREDNLIRFRPFGDEKNKREEEAVAVLHGITDRVLSGEYLIGHSVSDAKKII